MRFRPCIDIHNGKVKQIVGGSLRDEGDSASTNFSSELGADHYARMYRKDGLKGGHIIMLNHAGSGYYEATRQQALSALAAYPGGMQIGGGITAENAAGYLESGASHVIVTSYVFRDGSFCRENMEKLVSEAGREHIVLDLSCRKRDGAYYIVTDRLMKTSCDGLYAAGDVCIKPLRQVVTAVGDGALAATELERYAAAMQKKTGLHPEQPSAECPGQGAADPAGKTSAVSGENVGSREPKSAGIFTPEMTAQLRTVFDKMSSSLILELYLDDTPLSMELKSYAEELAGLTEKIQLKTIRLSDADSVPVKAEELPCVRVCRKDGWRVERPRISRSARRT